MNTISFMSANFVARELGYGMTQGWMQGDAATQAYFRPGATFAGRFDAMLGEISVLGFKSMDLWVAHLNPAWATEAQITRAGSLLQKHGLSVASLAVWLPQDPVALEKVCDFSRKLGIRILGGGCENGVLGTGRQRTLELLEEYDLVFAYENHPEKTPEEILEKIGPEEDGRIGIALDTGWMGTHGYDAAEAVRRLAGRILHVHLKDIFTPVKGPGPTLKEIGQETCALGDGVVPIRECLKELEKQKYRGGLSIEHEPEDHDPRPEVTTSLQRLQSWLNS